MEYLRYGSYLDESLELRRIDNHERYHEGIGQVTSAHVYHGRRGAILGRRAAQQRRTQAQRVRYNRAVMKQGARGERTGDRSVSRSLTESQGCPSSAPLPPREGAG